MFKAIKFAAAGAVIAAAMASTSAYAATETADATVNVLGPIEITVDNVLDFGTIAPTGQTGSVVVGTTNDTATCTNVVCVATTAKRGEFHINYAVDGAIINVAVDTPVNLSHSDPLNTTAPDMVLSALQISDNDVTYVASAATQQAVFVGGSLAVAANQEAGVYNGSFNITADYQ